MTFRFIYATGDHPMIIQSVLIDKRASISAIRNKIGSVIKDYCDQVIAQVGDNTIFYKIETSDGNLAGYFSLSVFSGSSVALQQYELRPPFAQFDALVSNEINNFMQSQNWTVDILK
ncbi:MAG TPA: hypothetical protein PKI55_10710 [Chitinophagaceae bacterium]|nr:hypothetical protein [Chitinophagaceae bacterium]